MFGLLLPLFLLGLSWAKPQVLVSYYDAFDGASFNNSERVALGLKAQFQDSDKVGITLCRLPTIYDKAFTELETCLSAMPDRPTLILGLGEAGCDMKLELVVKNNDFNKRPDNSGERRYNSPIMSSGPAVLGLRYPLPEMYCSLSYDERDDLIISSNAGSFVCNNTSYQLSSRYPDIPSGFIHVPAQNCRNLEKKTQVSITNLKTMITRGMEFLESDFEVTPAIPHPSNSLRLPTSKKELEVARFALQDQKSCLLDFMMKARGAEERGWWNLLNLEEKSN